MLMAINAMESRDFIALRQNPFSVLVEVLVNPVPDRSSLFGREPVF